MQPTPPLSAAPSDTIDAGAFVTPGFVRLLVVEPQSSRWVDLPASGEVLIGRDSACAVRLEHKSVSRRHARLHIDQRGVHASDEGSHNGTRVNGDLVASPRALGSGDTISVGEVVLIVRFTTRHHPPRVLLSAEAWRTRLHEEVARGLGYGRSLAVVVLAGPGEARADAIADAAEHIDAELRPIDIIGAPEHGELWLLLPELEAASAQRTAAQAVRALHGLWPTARAGVALFPLDSCDADALLLAARRAARAATAGKTATTADATIILDLDGRRVLLADPGMQRQFELIRRLAVSDLPVLVCGETGVGKENAAFAVHHGSRRRSKPFVPVSCAAIPETLLESMLFGHEKGSFTGASASHVGLLESAAGGTVFLDEIGELSTGAQAKLLRALDAHAITRLGDTRERPVDVRVVAATNRDLDQEVLAGRFREDLYFRLGARVVLPPLRERPAEIPLLAREFLAQACARLGRPSMTITPAAMQVLCTYGWPGNVRDLRMVLDVVAATVDDDRVEPADLPERVGAPRPGEASESLALPPPVAVDAAAAASEGTPRPGFQPIGNELDALLRQRMLEALEAAGGVRTRAAALLSMPIRTFTYKMRQFGLKA